MRIPLPKDLPKTLIIGQDEWQIRFVDKIQGKKSVVGLCTPGDKIIHIRRGMSHYDTFTTLVHEVLHAFEYSYNFELPHEYVEIIEIAIGDFILQNLLSRA